MNAKRLAKKFAAISMVAAMVFTAPAAVFADDGQVTSEGTNNGHFAQKKTLVSLPTINDDDVAFVVDPERLINATSSNGAGFSAALATGGATGIISANSAGVYFPKSNQDTLSGSAAFTARNIGTEDVKLEIEATPSSGTILTDSTTYISANTTTGPASLYLAINATHSGNTADITGATDGVGVITGATTISIPISGTAANYVTTANAASTGYAMSMKPEVEALGITNAAAGWDSATFSLEGYCQEGSAKNGDDDLDVPDITIVWNIKTMDGVQATNNEDGSAYKADENGVPAEVEPEPEPEPEPGLELEYNSQTGNMRYVFPEDSAPTGTLTACVIDDTPRAGAVANGNLAYNASIRTFAVKAAVVDAYLPTGQTHTVVATIGGQEYTFAVAATR